MVMESNELSKDSRKVNQKFKQGKSREDFSPNSKVTMKLCEYCCEPFWTNRPSKSKYCNIKSTCRVYAFGKRADNKRARELISILKSK